MAEDAEKIWNAISVRNVAIVKKTLFSHEKEKVRDIIEHEANKIVFSKNLDKRDALTCLHFACKKGMVEILQMFFDLSEPLDLNMQTKILGWTPMHYATFGGHVHCLKLLAKQGANVNSQADDDGRTPLMLAICKGFRKIAAYLVHVGADVQVQDDNGNSALHYCVRPETIDSTGWTEQQRMEMVEFLIIKGLPPELHNDYGDYPLHLAAKNGAGEQTIMLLAESLEGVDPIDQSNFSGLKPMHLASTEVAVQTLVELGADINTLTPLGLTPLHLNIANPVMISALLRQGVNTKLTDHEQRTALHMTVMSPTPNLNSLHLLCQNAGGVNLKDVHGNTPLHLVCANDYKYIHYLTDNCEKVAKKKTTAGVDDPIIVFLMAMGGIVNLQNKQGETPLHVCISHHNMARANLLLQRGADSDIADNQGKSPRILHPKWFKKSHPEDPHHPKIEEASQHGVQQNNTLTPTDVPCIPGLVDTDIDLLAVSSKDKKPKPKPPKQKKPAIKPSKKKPKIVITEASDNLSDVSLSMPTWVIGPGEKEEPGNLSAAITTGVHAERAASPLPNWVINEEDNDHKQTNKKIAKASNTKKPAARTKAKDNKPKPAAKKQPAEKTNSKKLGPKTSKAPTKSAQDTSDTAGLLSNQLADLQGEVQDVCDFLEEFSNEGSPEMGKRSTLQRKNTDSPEKLNEQLTSLHKEVEDVKQFLEEFSKT